MTAGRDGDGGLVRGQLRRLAAAEPNRAGDGAAGEAGAEATDAAGSRPRVGLFVDGPNVLREEFDVDLDDVRTVAADRGRLVVTRLYLDENAPAGLVQAAEARGFDVRVTSGDVDVKLAVDATALVVDGACDVFAIASRDTDFKPALERAAERGVRTVAIAPGSYGRSDALRNAATESVTLGE